MTLTAQRPPGRWLDEPAPAPPAQADGRGHVAVVDLVKEYSLDQRTRRVLDHITFGVRAGEKIAVLGRNGAGKSCLIRLLAGIEYPTSGSVVRTMSMSWPIALNGGFNGSMTGNDCVRFLCRVYQLSFAETRMFVDDFAELGKYMRMPIKTYSSGMRARLTFGLSFVVDFDCYLIDEVMSVGDRRFQQKCFDELFVKRSDRAMIIASHDLTIVREFCDSALVLRGGRGRVFHDLELACNIYTSL